MNKNIHWESVKKYLLAVQKEYEERNGLPYCKNCGVDFGQLIKDFEAILKEKTEPKKNQK